MKHWRGCLAVTLCFLMLSANLPVLAEDAGNLVPNGGFEQADAVGFPVGWHSDGQNLMVNGGFEDGMDSNWKATSGSYALSAVQKSEAPDYVRTGDQAGKADVTTATWGSFRTQSSTLQAIPVEPGQQYLLRGYAKTVGMGNIKFYMTTEFEGASKWTSKNIEIPDGAADWTELADTMTIPDGATSIKLIDTARTGAGVVGAAVYHDDFAIEKMGRTDANAQAGEKSLKIVGYGDRDVWTSDASISLAAGKAYRISYYVKMDGNAALSEQEAVLVDTVTSEPISVDFSSSNAGDGWTKMEATFLTNGAQTVNLELAVTGNATAWFDEVSVTEAKSGSGSVEITADPDVETLAITTAEQTIQYTGTVLDGVGMPVPGETLVWRLEGDDTTGVILDETGLLTVRPIAVPGTYTIRAEAASDPSLVGTAALTLTAAQTEQVNLFTNGGFEEADDAGFPTGWTSDGQNLMVNGGFEDGKTSDWQTRTGWMTIGATQKGAEPDYVRSGEQAGKGTMTAGQESISYASFQTRSTAIKELSVQPGQQYQLRTFLKTVNMSGVKFHMEVEFAGTSKVVLKSEEVEVPSDAADWFELSWTVTAPETASAINLIDVARVQITGTDGMTVYLDDFSLEKIGRTDADALTGDKSLKIVGYGEQDTWRSGTVALTEGVPYTFSYAVKGTGTGRLVDADSEADIQLGDPATVDLGNGWTKYTYTVTPAANGTAFCALDVTGNDVAWFDDVMLTTAPTVEAVSVYPMDNTDYLERMEGTTGDLTKQFAAVLADGTGGRVDGAVTWAIEPAITGVSVDADGLVTVADTVAEGTEITVAASAGDVTGKRAFTIVSGTPVPVRAVIEGTQQMGTWQDGKPASEAYTLRVTDQHGDPLTDGDVAWEIVPGQTTATGFSIDDMGVLAASETATAGIIALRATVSKNGTSCTSAVFLIQVRQSVRGVSFVSHAANLTVGASRVFTASIQPADAANQTVLFTTDAPDVISLSADGPAVTVTALAEGDAVVTATTEDGSYTDRMTVHVTAGSAELDLTFEQDGAGWTYTPVNLVPNPGFEADELWTNARKDIADARYVDRSEMAPHSGNRCAAVEYTPSGTSWAAFRNSTTTAEVNPYSSYEVGAWLKMSGTPANGSAELSFRVVDTPDAKVTIQGEASGIARITQDTDEWTEVSTTFEIGEKDGAVGRYVQLFAARTQNGAANFKAYFDDFRFETIGGIVAADAYAGTGAMRIGAYNGLHGAQAEQVLSDVLPVQANKTYTVQAMAKSSMRDTATSANAAVGIQFVDAAGAVVAAQRGETVTNTAYGPVSVTATAPAGASGMRIVLAAGGTGFSWFDNVFYAEEISEAAGVIVEGPATVALPVSDMVTKTYVASVVDQFGVKMPGESAALSLASPYAGVSMDNGVLTVTKDAAAGTVQLLAQGAGFTGTMDVSLVDVGAFRIVGLPTNMSLPSSTQTYTLTAAYTDADGQEVSVAAEDVIFSLASTLNGVTLTDNVLTVSRDAQVGSVTVHAVWKADDNVTADASFTLSNGTTTPGGSGGSPSGGGGSGTGSGGGGVPYVPGSPQSPGTVNDPTASIPKSAFADVPAEHWAFTPINAFAELGFINGKDGTNFDPDGMVTRAEFVKMLSSAMGIATSGTVTFTDAQPGDWYYPYVAGAAQLGIVQGYEDGSFGANRAITRQEMATLVKRAADALGKALPTDRAQIGAFGDQAAIAAYAVDGVEALRQAGVLSGDTAGNFCPQNNATRAETVKMLYQVYLLR